jgi:hypothetical protein
MRTDGNLGRGAYCDERIEMTERKPPEMSFTSWVDQQISAATERGAFDNLPGAGKPLPRRGQSWLQEYLRREGVAAEELLPTPLKLRKEIERLTETVRDLRTEQEVREVVRGLNQRIMEWRRIPLGPAIFLPLVGEETMVRTWRDGHSAPRPTSSPARASRPSGETANRGTEPPRPRWWHRLSRGPRGYHGMLLLVEWVKVSISSAL